MRCIAPPFLRARALLMDPGRGLEGISCMLWSILCAAFRGGDSTEQTSTCFLLKRWLSFPDPVGSLCGRVRGRLSTPGCNELAAGKKRGSCSQHLALTMFCLHSSSPHIFGPPKTHAARRCRDSKIAREFCAFSPVRACVYGQAAGVAVCVRVVSCTSK